jgi:hypothetical protein
MEKSMTVEVKFRATDTPQAWQAEGLSGLEQLAGWMIIKKLAETEIEKMLAPAPPMEAIPIPKYSA